MLKHIKKISKLLLAFLSMLVIGIIVLLIWGRTLTFENRFAPVVYDQSGEILSASVSSDQQWRIHCSEPMPDKLKTAIRLFEDEYFYYHPGVNPFSIIKAFIRNKKAGKIKRGGSTLTMQLARIYYKNHKRGYLQKIKETFLALAIELNYSKESIINMYGQYAPFGGNIVGYCAASYKYYDKPSSQLSWSESVTMAVLPNAPSAVFPGKAQEKLQQKRNYLLKKLLEKQFIDSTTYRLSLLETIPIKNHFFDNLNPHLLTISKQISAVSGDIDLSKNSYKTHIDKSLQKAVKEVVNNYHRQYKNNGIDNMAVLVLRNNGKVAAYVSNTTCKTSDCGRDVDIIHSFRSPGSILKPFLYGLALDKGYISTTSLLLDIPTFYNGFSPKNFDRKFRGIIAAKDALTMSLNVPAVNLLSQYGIEAFLNDMNSLGFIHTNKGTDFYGLSLILGGNEVSMMEVGQAYMNLVRTTKGEAPLNPIAFSFKRDRLVPNAYPISRGASWLVLQMLSGVNRPSSQDGWQYFTNKKKISWKTGTSYGYRDAWSVGVTSDYTVVVWVGNADGEGKNGLTGIKKAAPILFSTFELLPSSEDIPFSYKDLRYHNICKQSGYTSTDACPEVIRTQLPISNHHLPLCHFHKIFTMDETGKYRVNSSCHEFKNTVQESHFVLNPIVNSYYKKYSSKNHAIPPLSKDCEESTNELAIIYPLNHSTILIPKDVDGKREELICSASNAEEDGTLFWFLDHLFLKETNDVHKLKFRTDVGHHQITIVSSSGNSKTHKFEVIE